MTDTCRETYEEVAAHLRLSDQERGAGGSLGESALGGEARRGCRVLDEIVTSKISLFA